MKKAMEKLDLLVVIDPYPTVSAVMHDRTDGVYLLPASTQFETYGSVTASNRSIAVAREGHRPGVRIQARPRDHVHASPRSSASPTRCSRTSQVNDQNEPLIEDITREFNKGMWTIGYTGQSPERLRKAHGQQHTFDKTTLQGQGRSRRRRLLRYALAVLGHRGDGASGNAEPLRSPPSRWPRAASDVPRALRCRAGRRQPAGRGTATRWARRSGRLSRIHHGHAEEARLGQAISAMSERAGHRGGGRGKDQLEDRPVGRHPAGRHQAHGCAPFGNAKARTVVWTFPDPVPIHREPLYTPRRDLVEDYPDLRRPDKQAYRLPTLYESIQKQGLLGRLSRSS